MLRQGAFCTCFRGMWYLPPPAYNCIQMGNRVNLIADWCHLMSKQDKPFWKKNHFFLKRAFSKPFAGQVLLTITASTKRVTVKIEFNDSETQIRIINSIHKILCKPKNTFLGGEKKIIFHSHQHEAVLAVMLAFFMHWFLFEKENSTED